MSVFVAIIQNDTISTLTTIEEEDWDFWDAYITNVWNGRLVRYSDLKKADDGNTYSVWAGWKVHPNTFYDPNYTPS